MYATVIVLLCFVNRTCRMYTALLLLSIQKLFVLLSVVAAFGLLGITASTTQNLHINLTVAASI